MKISISATNPCHLYSLALELAKKNALAWYYSGYPKWKLQNSGALPLKTHSWRTTIVYGLLKYAPAQLRPDPRNLYLWQDRGFDAWAGRTLSPCDFLHAMPGQCVNTFESAKRQGIKTVLNHATGPVRKWIEIMRPEYERAGLDVEKVSPYDAAYFKNAEREYALADYHCAASSLVRDQLMETGISGDKIWVVPYAADSSIFYPASPQPSGKYRIIFAGQIGLRKGIKTLLDALQLSNRTDWEVHFYGTILPESEQDIAHYNGKPELHFHNATSQRELAEAFRNGSVLVLPSLEEGFGLVVPQALNCGLPCIVSDCVGAKDLIKPYVNGSIFEASNAELLLEEFCRWETMNERPSVTYDWADPARQLLEISRNVLS